jgi:hypothetical protein
MPMKIIGTRNNFFTLVTLLQVTTVIFEKEDRYVGNTVFKYRPNHDQLPFRMRFGRGNPIFK